MLSLPSPEIGVGIMMGAMLSMTLGDKYNEDVNTLLTNLGILSNNNIYMDKIIQYISYDKNEETGTFVEVNTPGPSYAALGYDT